MAVVIQFRHDDADVWVEENPVLAEGEVGVELDTDLFKIGNGLAPWNSLPYAQRGPQGEKGEKGDKGDKGATGADSMVQGPDGMDGFTVLNGAGAPGAGTGVNGDFYINLSASSIYGPKTGGAWGSAVSLIGPKGDTGDKGDTGTAGFTVLSGPGVPGAGYGVNGDFYIDTTGIVIYGPKAGGAWGVPTTMVGPQGDKGDKGDKGDEGDAATVAVGTITPVPYGTPSTVTNVGTQAAAVFNFELETGEKGDQGDKGDKGDQGDKGDKGDLGSVAGSFGLSIDGAGAAITPGLKQYMTMPFACTINGWHIVGSPAGSVVIDLWKASGALPTGADTITGTEKPTLSSSSIGSNPSLSTWTVEVAAGDIIAFVLESCTLCQKLTLTVAVTK